jgi:glucose/arabinose dehydrogenase
LTLRLLRLLVAALLAAAPAAAREGYGTSGTCDGFPRLALKTPAGFCVGLIAEGLTMPRGILALPDSDDLIVAEMGGWVKGRGSVIRLRWHAAEHRYAAEKLLDGLDRPHGLAPARDGRLYVGAVGTIFSFDPADPAKSLIPVVTGLPDTGRHPLAAFAVDPAGGLYVNLGSLTDNCEGADGALPDPAQPCPETLGAAARGLVKRIVPTPEAPVDARAVPPFATGLRNSVALAVAPGSGLLLVAENARDRINQRDPSLSDEELPHDRLVLARDGADFGWPYCFDDRRPSPEYKDHDCRAVNAPLQLLPAHAAPLGMIYDSGRHLDGPFAGALILTYHGYRRYGHRIVAFAVDADGLPAGAPRELVGGWERITGKQPRGTPVGLAFARDGALLITEDINGTVLRLAREKR